MRGDAFRGSVAVAPRGTGDGSEMSWPLPGLETALEGQLLNFSSVRMAWYLLMLPSSCPQIRLADGESEKAVLVTT